MGRSVAVSTQPVARSSQAAEPHPIELTVLMPCLNEAETISICVVKARHFLERSGVAGEVLVADNGSTDGSQALAERAGARVVPVDRKGYGAALAGGIDAARGRFIIMGDADDSYDFLNLQKFVDALRDGADLVMGNRFQGGVAPGAMPPLHKYLGNPVLSFLGRLFFRIPVGDFHCGLRGFRAESIRGLGLQTSGMEFASEMVVKASLSRLKIVETPTTLSPDGRTRSPHLNTWRDGWRHLRFLLLHSPRWLFLYPALALIALGMTLVGLTSVYDFNLTPGVSLGVHSLLVGCFATLVGSQLLSFAVLARQHAASEKVLPASAHGAVLNFLSLERILQIAAALLVLGLAGVGGSVAIWAGSSFGPLQEGPVLRLLSVSLTLVAVSVQLAGSGFLASVFKIRRKA